MILGKSKYIYNLSAGDQSIETEPALKILGITLDKNLSYKLHVDNTLWHMLKLQH